jgi:hypothetical protein
MKNYRGLFLVSCVGLSLNAVTLKTDFLRTEKTYKDAQFPLEIKGYLDLSFRVVVDDAQEKDGVMARIERRFDGELTSFYSDFFPYNKEVCIEFPDGNIGPKVLFEREPSVKNS